MWFKLGQKFALAGHHVVQISRNFPGLPQEETRNGVRHRRTAGFDQPSWWVWRLLLDLLYTIRASWVVPGDADVVITNTFWAPIIFLLRRRPLIYVDVARMPKGQMKFYWRANTLRANSSAVASAIKAELSPSRWQKVSIVPNPLPFDCDRPVKFAKKENVVLYTGRIHEEKGLDLLAKAMALLQDEPWTTVIVGPWQTNLGGSGDEYLEHLRTLFRGASVHFVGPIFNDEELSRMYETASIFVYPSLAEKGETFGLAPLEAMSWGVVPVVSDLECFKDFVKTGENGVVFDHRAPNACEALRAVIGRLMQDRECRTLLAVKALEVRDSHSLSAISECFMKDFEQQIALRRRAI